MLKLGDKSATRISTTVSNNRAEVPHGCYFQPANSGDFRLFWNEEGLMDDSSTERVSICTKTNN